MGSMIGDDIDRLGKRLRPGGFIFSLEIGRLFNELRRVKVWM